MFHEGRQVGKKSGSSENSRRKFIENRSDIQSKKWTKPNMLSKSFKIRQPGHFVGPWVDFWWFPGPKGHAKIVKNGRGTLIKITWDLSWGLPGIILGAWLLFFVISAHFCLHFRTLWARFWIHCGGFVDFFNKQTNEAARQPDSKTATRKEEKQTATQEPNIPTTKWFGSAECAKRLKFNKIL